jgi:hypothetical protein
MHYAKYIDSVSLRSVFLWDTDNEHYSEWKKNLERANLIDINTTQKVKNWSALKIYYYSYLIRLKLYSSIIKNGLKKLLHRTKHYFIYQAKPFLAHHLINVPERLIGRSGAWIQKRNPELYNKLKKIKSG